MKNKLLKLAVKEGVSFIKVTPNDDNTRGFCWQGFSVMSQHVLGNSKMDILKKMYEIRKKLKKERNHYNSLPNEKDILNDIKNGKDIEYSSQYETRCTGKLDKGVYYPQYISVESGKELLRKLFMDTYFEIDFSKESIFDGWNAKMSYELKRNNLEIDNNFWGKHSKLVEKWITDYEK
jgi:hypothetical protein